MNDWLSYLEKYRSDKLLYERLSEGCKAAREPPSLEKTRLMNKLESSVLEAEERLEQYIEKDLSPQEAARQASEKLFLSYRYLYGMTMVETATAMSVSRDTVYRIRRRILSKRLPFD